jgi:hypothetical protein
MTRLYYCYVTTTAQMFQTRRVIFRNMCIVTHTHRVKRTAFSEGPPQIEHPVFWCDRVWLGLF